MSSSKTTGKSTGAKRRPATAKAAKSAGKRANAVSAKPTIAKASKPAKAIVGNGALSAEMAATAAAMEKVLAAGDLTSLSNDSLQKLMAAVVKIYSAKREAGDHFLPLNAAAGRVTPTDIMLTSSQMLRAGNLQVFELGMWQSWTGN